MKSKAQDLLEKLFEATVEKTEKIPHGFHNIEHWCRHFDLCRSRATQYLKAGVLKGIIETRKFRTFENGRYYRRHYYREIV